MICTVLKTGKKLGKGKYVTENLGFPDSSAGKESCNGGDIGHMHSIPGLGRSPEKEMAAHSSILAWEIPWTEKPGGLQSMESQRVRHNWVTEHKQEPPVYHRELYSVFCNNLHGKRIWKRMDICVCINEPLCCTSVTNKTLLVNYIIPYKIKIK